jgi:hypothetical protein
VPPKATKKNWEHLLKLLEEEKRLDIMTRFWHWKKLQATFGNHHPHNVLMEKREEIEQFVFGSNSLVQMGLKWGLLEERPERTKKKEAKKRKKEMEKFFDGE